MEKENDTEEDILKNTKIKVTRNFKEEEISIAEVINIICEQFKQQVNNNNQINALKTLFKKDIENLKEQNDKTMLDIITTKITNKLNKTFKQFIQYIKKIGVELSCCRIYISQNEISLRQDVGTFGEKEVTLLHIKAEQEDNGYTISFPPDTPFFSKYFNDCNHNEVSGVVMEKSICTDITNKTSEKISSTLDDLGQYHKIEFTFNKQEQNNNINNVLVMCSKEKHTTAQQYNISFKEDGDVDKITIEGQGVQENECKNFLKKMLSKQDDEINKNLIENIECELDREQKKVFDKIKAHLGVVKEKEKEEKNKEEEKEEKKEDLNNSKDTNINNNDKDSIESKSSSSHDLDNSDKEKDSEYRSVEGIKNNQTAYNLGCIQNKWIGTPVNGDQNTFHCFCFDI